MIHKLLLYSFIFLYGIAGILHFVQPDLYLEVIPEWLGNKVIINYLAGAMELLVAILAYSKNTRVVAVYITIAMLLAFTISHVYFIQQGSCAGTFCIAPWIAWVRLLIIHPLLIWWAWSIRKISY
ncbi:MAG: hypothetical protein ABJN73_04130 [Nonlabens ulvanivorans]|nr:hypothetical protein [Nonlabens ulvanivorans]